MIIGKQGYDLLREYQAAVGGEAALLSRLDRLLKDNCHDLALIASLSQEIFAAHHKTVSIYMKLQKYRLERNLGIEHDAEPDLKA